MAVALVTGSSTGIGLATAIHLARNGYETYASMRDPEGGGGDVRAAAAEGLPIHLLQLDVDSDASVDAAVRAALAQSGAIDVLVNNAGIGAGKPIEETSDADLRQVFETNFFGALRMVRAVLPNMRERRTGAIVNVTSLGGRVTFPSRGAYCATKYALEAASEALAIEVAPHGIRVAIIEPGVVLTPIFTKGSPPAEDSAYAWASRRAMMGISPLIKEPTMPEEVAAVILEAVTTQNPRLRYATDSESRAILSNRPAIDDESWVSMFGIERDEEFMAAVSKVWGEKGRLFTS
jgi:NAD(P)-dependent dehydrogenase (short-subunit alcohol dehydrogenase family)